jgi:hypothetical protein
MGEVMTDFRALFPKLLEIAELYSDGGPVCEPFEQILNKARVALAQPDPEPPTNEELIELFNENDWNYISPETFIDIARAVLERWGCQ